MAGRSPLRFIAPIALLAFAFALYTVVKDAKAPAGSSSSDTPAAQSTATSSKSTGSKKSSSSKKKRKSYTVKAGDTASGISAKTGVKVATMQKLNKNFDPGSLHPGQKIRLSE
jgi:LysM repeat protein